MGMTKKKSVTEDKKTKSKKDTIDEDNLKNELNEIMDKYVVEPDLESEEFSKMNEEEQFEFLNKQYIILVRMNNIINKKRSTIYSMVDEVYEKFKTSKTNEDNNSDNEISDEDVPAISEDEDDNKSDNESVEEVVPKKKKETSKKETLKKDKKYKKDKKSDEDLTEELLDTTESKSKEK